VQKLLEIQGTVACSEFGTWVIFLSVTGRGIWLIFQVRQQARWKASEIMCIQRKAWSKWSNSVFKGITWKQQHNYVQILQSFPKSSNFL